ncbi:MAG TPA: DNA gyrase inhibitor YacG [Pyrinomonadaceae bacterium]|nr:DNA gyrase inhibitor YacG [Pyrinomonadaceae bacterium]
MLEVKCPICDTRVPYEGNEFRPFCSERCKLLDFGAWVDEEYALPVEETSMTEEDIAAVERAQQTRSGNE